MTATLYQPWILEFDYECGAVGGMISRENESTQRKPAPVPLCPPQIPHDLGCYDGIPVINGLSYSTAHSEGKESMTVLKIGLNNKLKFQHGWM
jgi:hypothetical protein